MSRREAVPPSRFFAADHPRAWATAGQPVASKKLIR
jgi:hypothetical protein